MWFILKMIIPWLLLRYSHPIYTNPQATILKYILSKSAAVQSPNQKTGAKKMPASQKCSFKLHHQFKRWLYLFCNITMMMIWIRCLDSWAHSSYSSKTEQVNMFVFLLSHVQSFVTLYRLNVKILPEGTPYPVEFSR